MVHLGRWWVGRRAPEVGLPSSARRDPAELGATCCKSRSGREPSQICDDPRPEVGMPRCAPRCRSPADRSIGRRGNLHLQELFAHAHVGREVVRHDVHGEMAGDVQVDQSKDASTSEPVWRRRQSYRTLPVAMAIAANKSVVNRPGSGGGPRAIHLLQLNSVRLAPPMYERTLVVVDVVQDDVDHLVVVNESRIDCIARKVAAMPLGGSIVPQQPVVADRLANEELPRAMALVVIRP